jgi:phosphoesterase RecJ-like protein
MVPLDSSGLRRLVESSTRILLTGPQDPDGDSFGACLALQRAIVALTGARVDVAGVAGFRYAWLPGAAEMVPDERVAGPYDLAIVLDGDRNRLSPPVALAFSTAATTAIVDHHDTTSAEGYTLALIDREAESTCGMVLRLMDDWGLPLDRAFAEQLYVGVVFDTGGFRYSNTSAGTHRMAARLLDQGIDHSAIAIQVLMEQRRAGMLLRARVLDTATFHASGAVVLGCVTQAAAAQLGATRNDIEGIVDPMVYVQGCEVAVLLIERGPRQIKLSLRSRGRVNVALIARDLDPSGGGHQKAAGVLVEASLEQVRERVVRALEAALDQVRAA